MKLGLSSYTVNQIGWETPTLLGIGIAVAEGHGHLFVVDLNQVTLDFDIESLSEVQENFLQHKSDW
jgi:hypothetical protein